MTERLADESYHLLTDPVIGGQIAHEHIKQLLALSHLNDNLAVSVFFIHRAVFALLSIFTNVRTP